MSAESSRAIEIDMGREPFCTLSLEEQFKLSNMCYHERCTFKQYVIERNKLAKTDTQPEFSDTIKEFIKNTEWTFAKTYAETWRHEYIVQNKVDDDLFVEFAKHIDFYGYESNFYQILVIYFDYNGFTYWHMGNIINRCLYADTYRRREKDGRLPNIK